MKTKFGSVYQSYHGANLLKDIHGEVVATFNDWQVAEQVLAQHDRIVDLEQLLDERDDKTEDARGSLEELQYKIDALEEVRLEQHRQILALEEEIDSLKVKLEGI